MNKITVSIVTYNSQDFIERAVKSLIKNLLFIKYKIFLIDNASQDNTLSIVKYLAKLDNNIEIIKNDYNIGFGAAHNKVLNFIDSDYHIVMNPDIVITTNVIKELIDYIKNDKKIGLVVPMLKYPNGKIQYTARREITFLDLLIRRFFPNQFKQRQNYHKRLNQIKKPIKIEFASGAFQLFRTDIFKQINGFDENFFIYLEDADITKRVNKVSNTIFYPHNYVIHHWNKESYKEINAFIYHLKSMYYYFKKWGFKLY
ncbi:glycosyltransferase family 2 protein [Halanaerobium hydrogeniformans]|uniref:Glycosyl transferase family 2 n=1 Tax=Halanaerobium hydrogeniformans TaxID=656519 RepID=E4RM10_HALHG|nr:glycosyltransferase family 2 protein [Halanaerobium hydrogeniformans]ADQ14093.1 glycosyl transferase family 2 [Halanaerobium hydrogeniformans]